MEESRIPENTSKNTHDKIAELLTEDRGTVKVLDIPCGAGAFSHGLLKQGKEVTSADIENLLMFEHKRFYIADMNKPLPFADSEFDAVVCIDGIEHIENPFAFIRECNRILKTDGKLIISTPNISAMRSRWRWFITGHHNKCKTPLNENKPSPLHHIHMMAFPKIRYMLHTSGFRISRITTNRIKLVSWIYIIFYPFSFIKTWLVYRKEEKDGQQRRVNRKILKSMFSKPVFFGETIIVKAKKSDDL
ncbi:MAG: class I SAM-dependent methyltransferase [Bacteroidales bacterium]|nr:class I SAM-dependent methyltransferase [Bacteroidales bacterium]